MSGSQGRPPGERIASLEARAETDTQSIRDLWEALKAEREKRDGDDDELELRLNKVEVFMGRIALLMAVGSALGLLILGSVIKYIESLIRTH